MAVLRADALMTVTIVLAIIYFGDLKLWVYYIQQVLIPLTVLNLVYMYIQSEGINPFFAV